LGKVEQKPTFGKSRAKISTFGKSRAKNLLLGKVEQKIYFWEK
jgi:hypothetical protein